MASESSTASVGAAGAVSREFLDGADAAFMQEPRNVLARNTVTRVDVHTVLINRDVTTNVDHTFSTKVPTEGKATSQHATGRCWLFACCNVLRLRVIAKHNLANDFKLSPTFLFFYDKLEKANYFLENVLNTADEAVEGRLFQFLLQSPVQDGGQWDMVANILTKYGVVPDSAFQEGATTKASRRLNQFVTCKLREFARDLRAMMDGGSSAEALQARKAEMMTEIHRILTIHLGTPPTTFDWNFHDKDKAFHSFQGLTPQQFFREHVEFPVENMVSVINDPRHDYGATYTVDKLGNVVGGAPVKYLNLPVESLVGYATATLDRGEPVWFGCDVGKHFDRGVGIMDMSLLDYQSVYGTQPLMGKADRLVFGESLMTHAMVFTGYNAVNGVVDKFRVENSWGSDGCGDAGYHAMTLPWFGEFCYQVVVDKTLLSAEHQAAWDTQEPVTLPAWDPMGSLASSL